MNDNVRIAGIIFEHGKDDFGLWEGFVLSEEDENTIQAILSKYDTEGCSVRGTRKEIAEEINNSNFEPIIDASVNFLEVLKPYKGTTFSDLYGGGCELTYDERLKIGQAEMLLMLSDGKETLYNYIITHCDNDYKDYCNLYGGMIVMSANKITNKITWWLRED